MSDKFILIISKNKQTVYNNLIFNYLPTHFITKNAYFYFVQLIIIFACMNN